MTCALVRKLMTYATPFPEEVSLLEGISSRSHVFEARRDSVTEGSKRKNVHLITSGLACRYKLLVNGRRQIVAFLPSGDFCDLDVLHLPKMDFSVAALPETRVASLSREQFADLYGYAGIWRAMQLAKSIDDAIRREAGARLRDQGSPRGRAAATGLRRLSHVGAG